MITRTEAEEIAAGWARRESERRGYACTPMVSEFDLGFVVWTMQPPTVLPIPGDGARTVIDRETGAVATYPGVPADVVADLYRAHRPALAAQRRTADPEVELRRNARRRPSPTSAAHLTVDGRLLVARGAKGDQEIRHHPLVLRQLGTVDPRRLVRGAERHAELLVLSDALYEADRVRAAAGAAPITLDEARAWLRTAGFESFFVRESGDPLAGERSRPCETCLVALVDFALLPWSDLAFAEEWPAGHSDRVAQSGRFPAEVAGQLADAGWTPMHRESAEVLADLAINDVVRVAGLRHRHRPFPAVREVLTDFPALSSGRRGAGARRAIRQFTIAPLEAAHTADGLAELAEVVGAPLFPLGVEARGDAILAIDDRGRVFALDQGGEWFLGEGIDAVLTGLLTGDGPAERIRDDGTW
ncbi:SUKH-3 domain-containing protein [Jidongwangia harbinensis]|uniref:SUKH-3 domain-containing protein n=1 Tax=Jidongwangia harbinensis TaxID=2878561 RepID=UPI001CD9B434|nr:SUKH-3 domain-containing protein [Jidongwangia harbinensis]MCA2212697.1 SUKH-3 domain-containing protein [Jidongwangia harbinensis]